jgi:SAM-dependent methyltransferase
MTTSVFRRSDCRLCGATPRLILSLEPTPPGDHYITAERLNELQPTYPLDLTWCPNCHYCGLPDVVDPAVIYGVYLYNTAISLGLVEHFQQYADAILGHVKPSPGALVVDIGSNDGTLLQAFKARGMRVLGIDPATEAANKAKAAGVETLIRYFNGKTAEEIRANRGPATIVTANNVFANVDDLRDMVAGVRKLLAPDGVYVFETGYAVDLVRNTVFDNIHHEHLSYFAVNPLASFFRRNGMELIEAERVETKGGSLRGVVQLAGGGRTVSRSVQKWADYERNLGFDSEEPYRSFADRVGRVKRDLGRLLGELKAQGKTIAGYGASIGATTQLYHFQLSEFLSFLVDDNPIRHGLYTPGHHLPVLPSEALYERKPDYVLVFAWRYFDPIRKRHQEYLDQGGRFILPLPEVEVK